VRPTLWNRIRPKGLKFSFVGAVFFLFTATTGFLMFKFPMFHGIKVAFAILFVLNSLFFIRFREKHRKSLFERLMATRFFPRKLAFTNEGKFLVIISLGMGFAAVNTGSNLLYLLLGMLLAIITASGILSEFSVQKVSWSADLPDRAVAGIESLFPVRIRNDKRYLNSFSLEGEILFVGDEPVEQTAGTVLKLEPGRSDYLFSRVTLATRGRYQVAAFALGTRYPFSFFKKSRNFSHTREVVVVPRGEEEVEHVVFALATGFEEHANRVGRGAEFFSVRPMQPGDEWRDVHWKQSARHNRFAVKEYEALTARRVVVRLIRQGSTSPVDTVSGERAIEIAATLIRRLAQQGFDVGLVSGPVSLPPASGPGAVRTSFTALALVDLGDPEASFEAIAGGITGRDVTLSVDLDSLDITMEGLEPGRERRFAAGGAT
jgi:uncharacterized protein (DUF58 family)